MTDALVPVESSAFSIGQVVSRTFSVIGRHFVLFFGLSLVASLPTVLLAALTQPAAASGAAAAAMIFDGRYLMAFVGTTLTTVALSFLLSAVLTYGTVMDLNGRQVSVGEALNTALRIFFPLIAIAILYTLGIGLAFLALLIPGLMLMTAWAVAVPVRVIENTALLDTFSRSAELTKGHRWAIFGLLLAFGAIVLVVTVVSAPILGASAAARLGHLPLGYALVSTVIRAITAVISATGVACLYYELRVSKEGVGPNQLAAVFD